MMASHFIRSSRRAILRFSIIAIALSLGCHQSEVLQLPSDTNIHQYCAYRYQDSNGYSAQRIATLDDLPSTISSALTSHLLSRLGEPFYAKLELAGGEMINVEELVRLNPQLANSDPPIPTYIVMFYLKQFDPGAEQPYCAEIEMDHRGKVLQDIAFPKVASDRSKGEILSREAILEIAQREGLDTEDAWLELGYDSSIDSMVWLVSKTTGSDGGRFWGVTLHIEAHSGRFLRWSDYNGVV